MMPAGKHFDPVVGVDIHIIQPPGPVPPVPIPHPFVGFIIDPMDYAPIIGGTINVNGMKRAVAGSAGKCVPPHIPIGGVFVKPPANECEVFMGSKTVAWDGDPATRMAEPVLSCHDIGMPPIPRFKRGGKTKSMVLPTSVLLPIPAGPPVNVGGPPTIALMAMAMKLGMAGLGKAFKKLAKTKIARKAGAAFKKARQKAFKNMKPGFLKCSILKAEPVNCITGEVIVEQQDFKLPGRFPFEWNRSYGSQSDRLGVCGYGWQTIADARLVFEADGSVLFADGGIGDIRFPYLPVNASIEDPLEGLVLTGQSDLLRVRTKEGLTFHFAKRKPEVNEVLVEAIIDRRDNPWRFVRNDQGLATILDNSGRQIEVKSRNGRIEEMLLRHPEESHARLLVRYEYNAAGDLVTVLDPQNMPYRFEYNLHRLVQHTNRNGLSFYYEYDRLAATGRCVHTWGDGGLYDYRFEYDDLLRETRFSDSLGHPTTILYDDRLLPIQEVNALGGATMYEYDDVGRTTAIVDAVGNKFGYEYDDRGNVTKLTRPDGTQVAYIYNINNQVLQVIDANGGMWEQVWGHNGLLIEQKTPLGAVTSYEYDSHGQLSSIVDARGSRTTLSLDAFGNTKMMTDSLGHSTTFSHDALGNVIRRVDPLGRISTFGYDKNSRLNEITFPSKSKIRCDYDAENNLTRYVDPNGYETRLEYFGLGELAKRIQPDGAFVIYHYDNEERLIGITNQRGEEFKLVRDSLGRIIEEIDYWGQSRRFEYDGAGHLIATTDPLGHRIVCKNDPLGRIIEKLLPMNVTERFTYDGNGNLVTCENATATVNRKFDAENRLVKETVDEAFTIENIYDVMGNRISRKTSLGNSIEYEFDRLNQIAAARINDNEPINFERDSAGQITRESLSSRISRRFQFNDDGLITEQIVSDAGNSLFTVQFDYDKNGNLTKRNDNRLGIERFTYDPLEHVIEHLDPEGKIARFLNDPAGDRLRTRVDDSANHWRRSGECDGVYYEFDQAGNLVVRRDQHRDLRLTWDANQRLIESCDRGTTTCYGYDALGRRVFKETAGIRTWFYWDNDILVADCKLDMGQTEKKQPQREYVYYPGTFEPLALIVSESTGIRTFHYHNDPNGCPTRLTDVKGRVVWGACYGAWGKISRQFCCEIENPIRLQGQYEDPESGLSFNRNRYFDSTMGAFVSQDLLSIVAGPNIYDYAPNSLAYADPLGLSCKSLREAKDVLGIPKSATPTFQGTDRFGQRWWQFGEGAQAKVIVQHLPDATHPFTHFHPGVPKQHSTHLSTPRFRSDPVKYYPRD